MKYIRVKAATCALTASVMLFGSAFTVNASEGDYDLPAAGVGLVLEESASLVSIREEAQQSEKAAETVREAEESHEVTSTDIDSGVTGVGESVLSEKIVAHIQEQQVEIAITNGVGVASVLSTSTEQTAPVGDSGQNADGEADSRPGADGSADVAVPMPGERMIVEPVNLKKETQGAQDDSDGGQDDDDKKNNGEQDNQEIKASDTQQSAEKTGTEEIREEKKDEKKDEAAEEKKPSVKEEESTPEEKETVSEPAKSDNTGNEAAAEENQTDVKETESESAETESTETVAGNNGEGTETPDASQAENTETGSTETGSVETESAQVEILPEETPTAAASISTSTSGSAVVDYALQFVGNPYSYGGTSLTNGADCSGFVMSVYKNFGVSLPHSSTGDRSVGVDVGGLQNAQPGDIVCYSGHVGIYIGNNQIVHASTENTGIKVSEADYRTPITVRRVVN